MSNISGVNNTAEDTNTDNTIYYVVDCLWITGIVLSTLCLILQLVLFKMKPRIRKLDQKILTQLTLARLLNTIFEFLVSNAFFNKYTKDLTFMLYLQTDAVLICWMFVYTKTLYDKVVLVFALEKWNFLTISLLIWILTIPLGALCPVFLILQHFPEFYQVYAWLKFFVLTANVLFFCNIFYVVISRKRASNKNFTNVIKTCIILFILVCLTSLQVFINDISSYLEASAVMADAFCIINSYQAIAATIIFLILAKNSNE